MLRNAFSKLASTAVVDRISFVKAIAAGVDPTWGALVGAVGAGQAVSQSGGNLVITSGTTANAETIVRSLEKYTGALRLRVQSILSQRIANQSFIVELVDVVQDAAAIVINSATSVTVTLTSNPFTAENIGQFVYLGKYVGGGTFIPGRYAIASVSGATVTFTVAGFAVGSGTVSVFGWNYYHLIYDGTTATSAKFDTQRRGYASGDSAVTINTSASPGHVATIAARDASAVMYDQLAASSSSVRTSLRASRDVSVPDDAPDLHLQVRVVNGSSVPASTTTWTIGLISVTQYSMQDVVLQDSAQPVGSPLQVDVARAVALSLSAWPTTPTVTTSGDTGAKTATGNGATVTNNAGKGAVVVFNVGAVSGTTPTCVFKLQGSADGGTTWFDVPNAFTAAITATGVYTLIVFPGITPVAGTATPGSVAQVAGIIPQTFRVVWTIAGTTPSFTITNVQVKYLI